ncbi:hypothetical protein BDZ91DRAFT_849712 [Kalaharituber pfeilii]|nr:hypothetical protein BDZ91DRAFT_849712 [Kalaharituber pfeilii]
MPSGAAPPPGGFRTAYTQGVGQYYSSHGHTYRNPHVVGVTKCIHAILHRLLPPISGAPAVPKDRDVVYELDTLGADDGGNGGGSGGGGGWGRDSVVGDGLAMFDLGAGGGEATVAVREWVGRWMPSLVEYGEREEGDDDGGEGVGVGKDGDGDEDGNGSAGERKGRLKIYACDPYTAKLYEERVNAHLRRGEATSQSGDSAVQGEDEEREEKEQEAGDAGADGGADAGALQPSSPSSPQSHSHPIPTPNQTTPSSPATPTPSSTSSPTASTPFSHSPRRPPFPLSTSS